MIIGREIAISALREWAASLGPEAHKAVAVNNLGKWKTASQMVALALLLHLRSGRAPLAARGPSIFQAPTAHQRREGTAGPLADLAGAAGPALLCVAAVLTAWSMVVYFRGVLRLML